MSPVADPNLGPEMVSFALQGRGVTGHGDFFRQFHRLFLKKFPLTGARQVSKYLLVSRKLLQAVARRTPQEQEAARQEVFQRVIVPTGATLDDNEFDATMKRLREVMNDLAERYGVTLDPADIPLPSEEAMARLRENRRRQLDGAPPEPAA